MKYLKTFKVLAFLILVTSTFAQVEKIKTLQITGGTPSAGKILTSDENGVANWQYAPGSGDTGVTLSTTAVSPIHSSTGKVWMDRNLGASRRAQSVNDYMAYGQLYQWGRGNDGHADIAWTNATSGKPINGTTTILSTTDYPNNNLFIVSNTSPWDWRVTQNNNLWQGVAGINNPCPAGYRLPTITELTNEVTAYNITNSASAFASPLKFTTAGARSTSGGAPSDITTGYYWSSSVNGTKAIQRVFLTPSGTGNVNDNRALACCVRCIKN